MTNEGPAIDDGPPLIPGIDVTVALRNPTIVIAETHVWNPRRCPHCGELRTFLEAHHCRITGEDDNTVSIGFTRWLPGDPAPDQPATHTLDIVDEIDRLVDEQLQQEASGYDHNINQDTCWHCGRHWHGLPITEHIARMYNVGRYDPEYLVAEDDSAILCHGSDFIGPRRPTSWEQQQANAEREVRAGVGFISISPHFDMSSWVSLRERAWAAFAGVTVFRTHYHSVWVTANPTHGRPRQRGPHRGHTAAHLAYDEIQLHGWGASDRDPLDWARTGTLPAALVKIEFGPKTWHYELQREVVVPPQHQFPRLYFRPMDSLRGAVWDTWHVFLQPDFPVPPSPGYDFSSYDTLVNDDAPGWNALVSTATRPAATRPGHRRRTAPRSR